ncbi:MAG: hypothetical protein D6820_00535 [Lentisphaerae bacterium]|nr:MAG: hypothetical protein D6820_00535 [Lentisphaerota bacterium]
MKIKKVSPDEIRLYATEGSAFRLIVELPFMTSGMGMIVAALIASFQYSNSTPHCRACRSFFILVGIIVMFARSRYTLWKRDKPVVIRHPLLIIPFLRITKELS